MNDDSKIGQTSKGLIIHQEPKYWCEIHGKVFSMATKLRNEKEWVHHCSQCHVQFLRDHLATIHKVENE